MTFKAKSQHTDKTYQKFSKPVQWALFHHVDTPIFHKGSICLIGDAAYATTPH
jgi:2-polyprenyl-6-methoxyphenol hydroxylase-like FAD-dependent oxidoreductase